MKKALFIAIAAAAASLLEARAYLIATNAATPTDTSLITDASGNLLPAGSGTVAMGSFDVGDAEISAAGATSGAGSYFAQHFTAVESGVINKVPGVFEIAAPSLPAGDPLVGETAYIVIGNGVSIATSSAFLVYKLDATFSAFGSPDMFMLAMAQMSENAGGQLLVGEFGTHQAAAGPFQQHAAYSLSESGSIAITGLPDAYTVEPGRQLAENLVSSPPGADFALVEGPGWVSLDRAGRLEVSPPHGAVGFHTIVVRGSLAGGGVVERRVTLDVSASFAAWQERNFDLPAEAALAGPLEDPDGDGIVNLLKYAQRGENGDGLPSSLVATQDAEGRLVANIDVRDDDPALEVWFEKSANLQFDGTGSEDDLFPLFGTPLLDRLIGSEVPLGGGMKRATYRQAIDDQNDFLRAVISREP